MSEIKSVFSIRRTGHLQWYIHRKHLSPYFGDAEVVRNPEHIPTSEAHVVAGSVHLKVIADSTDWFTVLVVA